MNGLTAAGIACVIVFLIAILVGWIAARIDDRLEEKKIRDEWAEIERVAQVVPEPRWECAEMSAEDETVAFIAYLADRNTKWLAAHVTGELPVAA